MKIQIPCAKERMSPIVTEQEFIKYYDSYYDKIFNYIYRNVYHREIAEDLTSQTFLKALKNIQEKKKDIENFNAWIYKIATNEVLMHHRYKKGKKIVSMDATEGDFLETLTETPDATDHTDYIALEQAMGELQADEKLILELYAFEHKTYAEIAAVMNEKETTLRSKMHRTVKKLKKILMDGAA